jgi:hypothetical protein
MISPMTEPAPTPRTEHRDGYTASSDPARLDVDAIHAFLTDCYLPAATGVDAE